jgi:lipid-A-disaccharide synthase
MEGAGVRNLFDLTSDAVIGLSVFKKYPRYRRRFRQLVELAKEEKPELIVLIDFSYFNRRLAHAIRKAGGWRPRIVQYVSPQVWASRPGRAAKMARDIDLLLCLFPFEKEWYARRTPGLRVEWVGHPMFDRHGEAGREEKKREEAPVVLLLPGSRRNELTRHLPVMLAAARLIESTRHAQFKMVVPTEKMARLARSFQVAGMPKVDIQTGQLSEALRSATVAIAKTGTVTLECAYFGVPTVALYKTSFLTYVIGRRIVTVKYAAWPNILAGEAVFPEFIQGEATGENIGRAALELLSSGERRSEVRRKLREIMATLGGPGASERAAEAILKGD